MESYAHHLEDKIAELDDEIAELSSALTRARAQRAAYSDALSDFQRLQAAAPAPPAAAARSAPPTAGLPDASARLQAIIAVLREQPEHMMKAGALMDAVSERLAYRLSRHHVSDLLRAHPERFRSPRRGYWVLV